MVFGNENESCTPVPRRANETRVRSVADVAAIPSASYEFFVELIQENFLRD